MPQLRHIRCGCKSRVSIPTMFLTYLGALLIELGKTVAEVLLHRMWLHCKTYDLEAKFVSKRNNDTHHYIP